MPDSRWCRVGGNSRDRAWLSTNTSLSPMSADSKSSKRRADADADAPEPAAKRVKRTVKETTTVVVAADVGAVASTTTVTEEEEEEVPELSWDALEEKTMGADWREALAPEFRQPYFATLKAFLKQEAKSHKIFPPSKPCFSSQSMWELKCLFISEGHLLVVASHAFEGGQSGHHRTGKLTVKLKPPLY